MSLPALRQPKLSKTEIENLDDLSSDQDNLIVTLNNDNKLLITSDAYNGILRLESMYQCAFCGTSMELNSLYKELHKSSETHIISMRSLPYLDGLSENLLRKLSKNTNYCVICNVIVTTPFLCRHITSDVHLNKIERAVTKVFAYSE